jgi:hypothetical protein
MFTDIYSHTLNNHILTHLHDIDFSITKSILQPPAWDCVNLYVKK